MCRGLGDKPQLFSILRRHPYTEDLNSEMPGDSTNVFLHWRDVLGSCKLNQGYLTWRKHHPPSINKVRHLHPLCPFTGCTSVCALGECSLVAVSFKAL